MRKSQTKNKKTNEMALVGLAHLLKSKVHGKAPVAPIQTEHKAAVHITESLARFLER